MLQNSSLRNAKFDYLPSLIVVDEAGNVQSFKTPEGKDTNAMPTPKSLADMKRIVNVPVHELNTEVNSLNLVKNASAPAPAPAAAPAPVLNDIPQQSLPPMRTHPKTAMNIPNIPSANTNVLTIETTAPLKNNKSNSSIPAGNVYIPTPMVSPQRGQPAVSPQGTRPTSMKTRRRR
jgi:hypothetical protein